MKSWVLPVLDGTMKRLVWSVKIWPVGPVGKHAAKQQCVRSLLPGVGEGKASLVVAASESLSTRSKGSPGGGRAVER